MSLIGITFIVSLGMLAGILAMAYMEGLQGVRYGGNVRRVIDRRLSRISLFVNHLFAHTVDFLKRDVVARTLHLVSYLALTLVQYIEQQLVRVTTFFRSFRKRRHHKDTKSASWKIDESRDDS